MPVNQVSTIVFKATVFLKDFFKSKDRNLATLSGHRAG